MRRHVFVMSATNASIVLRALTDAGLHICVAGGWGVDALLARPTRVHRDLDLLLFGGADEVSIAGDVLESCGYVHAADPPEPGWWTPALIVYDHPQGMAVDLLPVSPGQLATMLGLDEDELAVRGAVMGCDVSCLSPTAQLLVHDGFELRPEQDDDMRRLLDAYGSLRRPHRPG